MNSAKLQPLSTCLSLLVTFLLGCKWAPLAHGQAPKDPGVEELERIMSQLPVRLHRLAVHFRSIAPMVDSPEKAVFDVDLRWDLTNDHYFSRTIQYADPEGKVPRHFVIEAWDGKVSYYWSRNVDAWKAGFGLVNGTPVDLGTVQHWEKPRWGILPVLQEMLFPFKAFHLAPFKDATLTLGFEAPEMKLGERVITAETPGTKLRMDLSSGWVIFQELKGPDKKPLIQMELSEFKDAGQGLFFPGKVVRKTFFPGQGPRAREDGWVANFDVDSLRFGDAVSFPFFDLPPGAMHEQVRQRLGKSEKGDAESRSEALLRDLLQRAERQLNGSEKLRD